MRLQKQKFVELNCVQIIAVIVSLPWLPSVLAPSNVTAPGMCITFSVRLHLLVFVCLCLSVSCLVGPEPWSLKFSTWQKRLGTTTRTLSQVNLAYAQRVRWCFTNTHAVITYCILPQKYVAGIWPVSTETRNCGRFTSKITASTIR